MLLSFFLLSFLRMYGEDINCNQGNQDPQPDPQEENDEGDKKDTPIFYPIDPNEIIGLAGYDTLQWVKVSDQLAYTIYFENDPEFATAAAQKVEIRYAFDPNLNMYSFGLGSFGFGEHVFSVEGSPNVYQTRLDMQEEMGIYVDVVAGLDVVKKEAFWIFSSIDPVTGLPPLEPEKGFLPVNDKEVHNGEGFVNFTILPEETCATRDTVSAQAFIVFDTNESIPTNIWYNTIDAVAPQSEVQGRINPDNSSEYLLTFTAEDDPDGSGVKHVIVYRSQNKEAYTEYAICAPDSILTFEMTDGAEYAFYSIAEDNTGNREAQKTEADFLINANRAPTDLILSDTLFSDDILTGDFIAEMFTEDTEENQSFVYELTEGDGAIHNDMFQIDGSQLQAAVSFKCADITEYKIRLKTTDIGGLTFSKAFTLTLENVLDKPEPDTLTVHICEGQSYDFYGTDYEQAGLYSYHKENEFECDSIYVLDLRVNPYPAAPLVSVEGSHTLISSASSDNQWYNEEGPIEGAVGTSFTPTETGTYYVTASNGSCESDPSEKLYVNLSSQTELNWDLKEGYSWISLNADSPVNAQTLLNPVRNDFEQLLSISDELIHDPTGAIVGEINELASESSYKIKVKNDTSLEYSGEVASVEDHPITLYKGWNWIGYLPVIELDVITALSGLQAENGDLLKGQTAFAVYENGWTGTLTSLKPGEGYLYSSVSEKTFTYSPVRVTRPDALRRDEGLMRNDGMLWDYSPNRYPNNMSIIARLYVGEQIPEAGIYTVGAFAGEECRGIGQYVNGNLFITVHGNLSGENISFKAFENATGEILDIAQKVEFDEKLLGSVKQPYPLVISQLTGDSPVDTGFIIYPNPVRSTLHISGNLPDVKNVKVLSSSGNPVLSTENFLKDSGLDVSALPDGVYLLALTTDQGIVYRKFIKSTSKQ